MLDTVIVTIKHDRHKITQHKTCDTVDHLSW